MEKMKDFRNSVKDIEGDYLNGFYTITKQLGQCMQPSSSWK